MVVWKTPEGRLSVSIIISEAGFVFVLGDVVRTNSTLLFIYVLYRDNHNSRKQQQHRTTQSKELAMRLPQKQLICSAQRKRMKSSCRCTNEFVNWYVGPEHDLSREGI